MGDLLDTAIFRIMYAAACLPLIKAGLIIFAQVRHWLEFGVWQSLSLRQLLETRGEKIGASEWAGLQKLLDWALAWPASVGLIAMSAIAAYGVHRLQNIR